MKKLTTLLASIVLVASLSACVHNPHRHHRDYDRYPDRSYDYDRYRDRDYDDYDRRRYRGRDNW